MSDADGRTDLGGTGAVREYGNLALVLACVVALVLATMVLPLASAVGLGGAPAESLVPVPGGAAGGESANGAANVSDVPGSDASGSGFGALNVGEDQSVGGPVAEGEANPYRSQDAAVHFFVTSSEPGYWRTGAYDTYTGEGWSQSGVSDATAPVEGNEVRYEVELASPASAAPTVWQPERVDGPDALNLTASGVARADGQLPAGTTYSGVSKQPPRDPAVLAASGRDYPDHVEERYTELQPETRDELEPFTSNLTADATSPYETAVAIEEWLEANKSYSLAVGEPERDVATEFVFEMDSGYCEYFATSMVAMLRTQDVPARYVVGYSTGEQVDGNTYRVRAVNAHAWVEVYFPDVGWVRFDPTPGQDRLQQERQAVEQQDPGASYEPEEEGSPNETFTPDATDRNETVTPPDAPEPADDASPTDPGNATPMDPNPPDDSPSDPPDDGDPPDGDPPDEPQETGEYDIDVNRSVVPGATVEVSVTRQGLPVTGAVVSFDDEVVGQTGSDGTVVAEVPFVENLTVSAESPGATERDSAVDRPRTSVAALVTESEAGDGQQAGGPASDAPGATDEQAADSDGGNATDAPVRSTRSGPSGPGGIHVQDAAMNGTRTFDVETNASLSLTGDARTGDDVVVAAAVADVPLGNATVWMDGERVARTDGDGRATVPLPDQPGNVTLRVARGPVSAVERVELADLTVDVEPRWPVPIAGTAVEVSADLGDQPASGAVVRVDGEVVGETGVNGTLTASLPAQSAVPVTVTMEGQRAEVTVTDPVANLAGAAALAVALAVGAAVAIRRYDDQVRALLSALAEGLRSLPGALVGALVGAAALAERALDAFATRLRRTGSYLWGLATGRLSPAEVAAAFRAWLGARLGRLRDAGGAAAARANAAGSTAAPDDSASRAERTVREAWAQFLDYVSVRRPGTKTPGQLAAHAIASDDLPADAVRTLRDEFRAVEYGPRSPDESVPAVEAAIEAIEAAASEGDDQAPNGRPGD